MTHQDYPLLDERMEMLIRKIELNPRVLIRRQKPGSVPAHCKIKVDIKEFTSSVLFCLSTPVDAILSGIFVS